MELEYYTLSSLSLSGYLLAAVCIGALLMLVAIMLAAGIRQARRDGARARSWNAPGQALVVDDLARRRRVAMPPGPYRKGVK